MLKMKTYIIEAATKAEAALTAMKGTWNEETCALICETFNLVIESNKTSIFCADWDRETTYSASCSTTAYVQSYDDSLGLYEVKVKV